MNKSTYLLHLNNYNMKLDVCQYKLNNLYIQYGSGDLNQIVVALPLEQKLHNDINILSAQISEFNNLNVKYIQLKNEITEIKLNLANIQLDINKYEKLIEVAKREFNNIVITENVNKIKLLQNDYNELNASLIEKQSSINNYNNQLNQQPITLENINEYTKDLENKKNTLNNM